MANKAEVVDYVAGMVAELGTMCRQAELTDLAFLLEVVASEAAKEAHCEQDRFEPRVGRPADSYRDRSLEVAAV